MMANIHNRMPAILTKDQEKIWLDESMSPSEAINMLETPYPSEYMDAYKVSKAVGNVRNRGPELIEPIED